MGHVVVVSVTQKQPQTTSKQMGNKTVSIILYWQKHVVGHIGAWATVSQPPILGSHDPTSNQCNDH